MKYPTGLCDYPRRFEQGSGRIVRRSTELFFRILKGLV